MNGYYLSVVALTLYKLFVIGAGVLFAFMGYKLFLKGVYEKAGELKAAWGGGKSLALKQAAPGTFFALFGCVVICFALFHKGEATSSNVSNLLQNQGRAASNDTTTADNMVNFKYFVKPGTVPCNYDLNSGSLKILNSSSYNNEDGVPFKYLGPSKTSADHTPDTANTAKKLSK